MTKKEITIRLASGLDARPVAMLVQVASQFESEIHVECDGRKTVNAKSIMGMMSLGLARGEEITIVTEGSDEAEAIEGIATYMTAKEEVPA